MRPLEVVQHKSPISWSISQQGISVACSLVVTQLLYFICSIDVFVGYTTLLLFVAFLFFSPYKTLLVYFYCWSVLFQNAFIAYASVLIDDKAIFAVLHGTNFFITAFLFVLVSVQWFSVLLKSKLFIKTILVLFLLTAFCLLGIVLYGFKNSIVYYRLYAMLFMMFWIGGYFASIISEDNLKFVLTQLLVIALLSTVGQFLFPKFFIFLMNDVAYYSLKGDANSVDEVIQILNSNTYFNIPSFGKALRAPGYIKSFISSAYFIVSLSVILFWRNKKGLFFFVFLIMSVCVASKGAFLSVLFFMVLGVLNRKFRITLKTALIGLLLIWIPLVVHGYLSGNEHIIGFVSGLSYLDTFGNGLGFSGNLSDTRLLSFNGDPLPDLGYWTRFYNGSESALGVLFSSLGVFSMFYILALSDLIFKTFPLLKHKELDYVALFSVIMIFQGIFQEEAFSPYAFGVVILVNGFYYFKCLKENTTAVL